MRVVKIEIFNKFIFHPLNKFKIASLDVGKKNIGIALSDENKQIAFPYSTIQRKPIRMSPVSIESLSKELQLLVNEQQICAFLVGMPLLEDGSLSPFCHEIIQLCDNISCNVDSLGIKMGENNSDDSIHNQSIVTFWNERNSTVNARQVIKNYSKKRNVQKQAKDSLAASLIMQGYLDSNNINI